VGRKIMVTAKKTAIAHRKMGAESWRLVRDDLAAKLTEDDDPTLWEFALTTIPGRTRADASLYSGKEAILVQIGCCSHRIRPKWKTASGMTWPFGYAYEHPSLSWRSLPQFDWSLKWRLDPSDHFSPLRNHTGPAGRDLGLPAWIAEHVAGRHLPAGQVHRQPDRQSGRRQVVGRRDLRDSGHQQNKVNAVVPKPEFRQILGD